MEMLSSQRVCRTQYYPDPTITLRLPIGLIYSTKPMNPPEHPLVGVSRSLLSLDSNRLRDAMRLRVKEYTEEGCRVVGGRMCLWIVVPVLGAWKGGVENGEKHENPRENKI